MYFTVNMAFVNYLDRFDNLTETLGFPILHNRTTQEQTWPISLHSSEFDSDLLKAPRMIRDLVCQFQHKKEIFDLQERHIKDNGLELTNKNSFFTNCKTDAPLFITAIILLVVTSIVRCIIWKHAQLKSLVTSLALEQIRGADANQEHVSLMQDIECTCKTQWYMIVTLGLVVLGIVTFSFINARKLKLFRGHMFSNAVKVMLLISDAQYYYQ